MRPDPKSGEAVNVKSKEKETLCFLPVYFRTSCFIDEGKITSKPVGKIVLTHEHFDHTGGTEIFSKAEIIAQKNVKNLV